MGHIFISYSHKDSKYVRKLEKGLKQRGFDVWIDERIDYGTAWPKVIQTHLDECEAFIVIVSENSFESEWVQNEVARAMRKGKPFFPLLLSGDPWLSTETTQYVDVGGGKLPPPKFYDRLSRVIPNYKKTSPEPLNSGNQKDTQPESASLIPDVQKPSNPTRKTYWWQKNIIIPIITILVSSITIVILDSFSWRPVLAPTLGTAVAQTQTAALWTPTITPIPDPNEPKIVEWLNEGLSAADMLEKTLDATYQARDVSFLAGPGSSSTVFRVDIRCQCGGDTQCCVPEQMFVYTMLAMKNHTEKIIEQVPNSVIEVKVVCYDNATQIAVLAASWSDAKGYLLDQINGYNLGSRVYRSNIP